MKRTERAVVGEIGRSLPPVAIAAVEERADRPYSKPTKPRRDPTMPVPSDADFGFAPEFLLDEFFHPNALTNPKRESH